MKKLISILLTLLLCNGLFSAFAEGDTANTLPKIDMSKWQYNASDDVYWQIGLSYAATPADTSREAMGIFVPGEYFEAVDNGDGTFTCKVNAEGVKGNYTAVTAPLILPVNTPGYAAMAAPTSYDSSMGYGAVSDYAAEGMIVLFAGARGRDAGAPEGVTDFKAAIRYARYNADLLPGDMESIFSVGMSGGGAQSSLIGATGDSKLYDPYLEAIGAVMDQSDAVKGSMCWCPITNLDQADEAYEWNMGNTRSGLSDEEQAISDGMAVEFAEYINVLGLTDETGNALLLAESDEGIFQSGTYYDYILDVIETSLEHFLRDNEFPYTASSSGGFGGGRGGMGGFDGQRPEGGFEGQRPGRDFDGFGQVDLDGQMDFGQTDGITRDNAAYSSLSLDGTYETKQDYIDALNAESEWVSWDETTGEVTISSVAAFTAAQKNASKSIAAFDQLDRGQGENILFGYGDGNGAHFDAVLSALVEGTEYEQAFTEDLTRVDSLGNTVDVRLNMYTPLYYLSPAYEGYQTSAVAQYWRIRSGITQGDTALCTEVDLALALESFSKDTHVDFETVWGLGHTMAERTGGSTENFIQWVNDCMNGNKPEVEVG